MMKKILLKTKFSKLLKTKFIVSSLALCSLVMVKSDSFGQTVVNFTAPTANSLGASNWAGSTTYSAYKYVYNNGNLYRVITPGTSDANYPPTGTNTAGSTNILNTFNGATNWAAATAYVVNQMVFSSSNLYKVSVAGTSGTTAPTGTANITLDGITYDYIATPPATPIYQYLGTIDYATTWTCPVGVTSIQVEAWGAGGGGGGAGTGAGRAGGGGGGGSYVKNTAVTVVPGTTYSIQVGFGGVPGNSTTITSSGNQGGNSGISGGSITPVVASGGGGASGTASQNNYAGFGGVLGGVNAIYLITGGSGYLSTSASITGGGGSGATLKASVNSGVIASIYTFTSMGTGYTSIPTVSFANGTGASATAFVNLDYSSGFSIGEMSLGLSGSNAPNAGTSASCTSSGAGGAAGGINGGAGGASQSTAGLAGINGVAPGGGGSGGFGSAANSASGGSGAVGQVTITYTTTQPVKMTSFAASKQGAAVQLKWSTASEQNNAYFDVQKSSDGQTFTSIGTKAGAGNSNAVLDYFFTDRKPSSGLNYYRLNQVDADGKSTLSNPVAIDFGFDGSSMEVYTTKNVSVLNLNIKSGKASTGKFVVYNIAGQKMLEQAISLNSGSNEMGINLPDLKKGIYVAAYQSGNQILTQKFIR
jgi:hypothetical protein